MYLIEDQAFPKCDLRCVSEKLLAADENSKVIELGYLACNMD